MDRRKMAPSWTSWYLERCQGHGLLPPASLLLLSLRCRRQDEYLSIGVCPDLEQPNPEPPTYAMKFCTVAAHSQVLALANEDGVVALQNSSLPGRVPATSQQGYLTGVRTHENAVFDLCWAPDRAERLATASGDKSAKVWDLGEGEFKELLALKGHERSVKVADFSPTNPDVLVTGSRDNSIRVWDARTGACENIVRNAHGERPRPRARKSLSAKMSNTVIPQTSTSITALKHLSENSLISCGDKDGLVKVWDLRRSYPRVPVRQYKHPTGERGFSSLVLDAAGLLYVRCVDGIIYQFDVGSFSSDACVRKFVGCENNTFFARVSLSGDGRFLACGSTSSEVLLWDTSPHGTDSVEPYAALQGHSNEVTCVDWCSSRYRLASCGDDMRHRFWELDSSPVDDPQDVVGRAVKCANAVQQPTAARLRLIKGTWIPNSSQEKYFLLEDGEMTKEKKVCVTPEKKKKKVLLEVNPCLRYPSKNLTNLPCSPKKMQVSPLKTVTPKKLQLNSITQDLPNLARNGKSPRTPICPPVPRTKKLQSSSPLLSWLKIETKKESKENCHTSPVGSKKRKRQQ